MPPQQTTIQLCTQTVDQCISTSKSLASINPLRILTILIAILQNRNSSELPKELTPEDRRELQNKEKARLERLGASTISAYSPRRERALKIYLDTSPKGRDD